MDEHPNDRRLLFIHAESTGSTTHHRRRSKTLDSEVRRHLMADIGKSRRKPPKTPTFDTLVWSLAESSEAVPSTVRGELSNCGDAEDHLQAPTTESSIVNTSAQHNSRFIATSPVLHALSVFEKQWGEDMFSAYGFALIMATGKNAMSAAPSTISFWYPFAFRKSAFLRHYERIFVSPDVMIPLYRRSAKGLRSLALERSLETIQCVQSRLSSSDADVATSDAVLQAVLAMTCYNLTTLDFAQALVHVKGLRMVVAARGGIGALVANQDLMRMISWMDITAALLNDTRPLFRLPIPAASVRILGVQGIGWLPAPLLNIIKGGETQTAHFMSVMSSLEDLNALAGCLQFELATKGSANWENEENMASLPYILSGPT